MNRILLNPGRGRLSAKGAAALAILLSAGTACSAQTPAPKPAAAKTAAAKPAPVPPSKQSAATGSTAYPGLVPELVKLLRRMQGNFQPPPARGESRLLPLLPPETMAYAAFPNFGEGIRQVSRVFQDELQSSAVLRDWWTHGDMAANGPKIIDAAQKLSDLQDFLGEEIVVTGAFDDKDPKLLILAEEKKPGLKKFLAEVIADMSKGPNPGIRVFDLQELPLAQQKTGADELLVLVRPDYVVAATDLKTLRSFNAHLNNKGQEFASSPFGARLAQEYQAGANDVVGANVQAILQHFPMLATKDSGFQRSGFADLQFAVGGHRMGGVDSISQLEVSFAGPRHGAAAWLGKPGPLQSLDFVSPKAIAAMSLMISSPAGVFDDIRELESTPDKDAFASLAMFEQMLKINTKGDLLNLLTGEITVELDKIQEPLPVWRAVLGVNDAGHLQKTLTTLFAAGHFAATQVADGGVTYYTVAVPNGNTTMKIAYTFMDNYLVIGSGQQVIADAVALHRSGGSLRSSAKFQAALPPGRGLEASAIIYDDPAAMVAMQAKQLPADIAEPLAQLTANAAPKLVCFYGDDNAIRTASKGGQADATGMLIVAAVAIPNLLRSRVAANEASAVGSVRTVNTAQVTYAATYPERGFAHDLATLGTDPKNPAATSANRAGFISETLANDSCRGGGWCVKSGYRFTVKSTCLQQNCADYVVVATPVDTNTGNRSFCSTSSGVIRWKIGGPVATPVSLAECKTWSALQ